MEGYRALYKDGLRTIFSAPNYCYRCGNSGSVCEISEKLDIRVRIFQASEVIIHFLILELNEKCLNQNMELKSRILFMI